MNARRWVFEEKIFGRACWPSAALTLVGLTVALACAAGQRSGAAKVFFSVEQSTEHLLGGGGTLSPDGSTLVYVTPDGGLYAADAGTGEKRALIRPLSKSDLCCPYDGRGFPSRPKPSNPRTVPDVLAGPAFSPDGRQIVFSASGGTYYYPSDIYSVHVDGSGLTRLTHAIQPIPAEKAKEESDTWYQQFVSPQFSPDGRKVLVRLFDPPRPEEEIAVMNADGSGLKSVAQGEPLFWGADSQSFYYAGQSTDIKKFDLASGTSEVIQGLPAGVLDPYSFGPKQPLVLGKLPDKDWFVVAAPDTGKISLMSVQHGAATFQTSLDVPLSKTTPKGPVSLVSVQWTPSGRVLLVYRGDEDSVKLERFEVAEATY